MGESVGPVKSKNLPKASNSAFCTFACQHKSSDAFRNQSIYNLELCLFRKDTRFPRACTSIRDYLSSWHFIGKRPSKRREVNIWLTILHSMDSLVQWDQRVWNGDIAKAKVEMGSNTNRDRNVENHAEIRTHYSHRLLILMFFLWLWLFTILFKPSIVSVSVRHDLPRSGHSWKQIYNDYDTIWIRSIISVCKRAKTSGAE